MAICLLPTAVCSFGFTYGDVNYEVLSENDKTCRMTGLANKFVTTLELPDIAKDGETEYSVVEIADNAVRKNFAIESLSLPSSLRRIGHGAFAQCYSMTTVTGGAAVQEIADSAFWSSKALVSIEPFESVETIGNAAFAESETLGGDFTLPATLKTLGVNPFYQTNLNVTIDAANPYFTVEDGAIYDIGKTELIFVTTGKVTPLTLPATMKAIRDYAAYQCKGLPSVTMNDGLESIGDFAFAQCAALKSADLGNTVKTIGMGAFWLTGITSLGIPDSVTEVGGEAFAESQLASVKMGSGMTETGYMAFASTPLTDISWGANLTEITDGTFQSCDLKSVNIPGTVKKVGKLAFNSCQELRTIVLNEGTEYIGERAFSNCFALTTANLPASVSHIESNPYASAKLLNTISIAEGNKDFAIEDDCLYTADRSRLIWCPLPKTGPLNVNPATTEIGQDAVFMCEKITEINLPAGLKEIGHIAFMYCHSVSEVVIPDNVEKVGDYAFSSIDKLEKVVIGESVKSIGANSFVNFNDCLTRVECRAAEPPVCGLNYAWYPTNIANTTLAVPEGCIEAYKSADGWGGFKNYEELAGIQEIADTTGSLFTVYTLQGVCIMRNADKDSLSSLPAGIYIINGRKAAVR